MNFHCITIARILKKSTLLVSICTSLFFAQSVHATKVQFQTVMGDFEVNLYDKTTPKTVENFLAYVKAGAYTNTVIHRAVPQFIAQGGGYKYDASFPLVSIPSNDVKFRLKAVAENAAVVNEPVYSNKRGTIAMAKIGGNANSATNQWFFNVADNSANLDVQNSGFTVFGEVTGNGMAIVDAMVALNAQAVNKEQIPLRNYTSTDAANNVDITDKNFVLILGVVILDASPDTAASLNPVKNTLINETNQGSKSSGGGAMEWLGLLLLAGIGLTGRTRK